MFLFAFVFVFSCAWKEVTYVEMHMYGSGDGTCRDTSITYAPSYHILGQCEPDIDAYQQNDYTWAWNGGSTVTRSRHHTTTCQDPPDQVKSYQLNTCNYNMFQKTCLQ